MRHTFEHNGTFLLRFFSFPLTFPLLSDGQRLGSGLRASHVAAKPSQAKWSCLQTRRVLWLWEQTKNAGRRFVTARGPWWHPCLSHPTAAARWPLLKNRMTNCKTTGGGYILTKGASTYLILDFITDSIIIIYLHCYICKILKIILINLYKNITTNVYFKTWRK